MSQLKQLEEFIRPYLGLDAFRKVGPQGGGVEWNTRVWSRLTLIVHQCAECASNSEVHGIVPLDVWACHWPHDFGGGIHRWRGAVGVTSAARVASRSSRSCFNTSLVTIATMSAVLHAASGTTSGTAGKSSGRPARQQPCDVGEWVVLARAAQPRRRASWLLGGGTAVSPWLVPVWIDVRVAAYCKC